MSENDPFSAFESDRTVIRPAGARASPAPAAGAGGAGAAAAQAAPSREAPLALDVVAQSGLNPLVAAASPLLDAVPRLRAMDRHPNPAGLKDALAEGVRHFEAQARTAGVPQEQIIAGRYILCTLLDEAAASTPWGGSGIWSAQSLLVLFHNETWGGEKVFQLLSKLAENVAANRNLLELVYVALALGFEGRYRVISNGRAQLDGVRERLAQLIRQERGGYEKELSPRWQGAGQHGRKLSHGVPLWVAAALAAFVMIPVFVGFRFAINSASDPVFNAIESLGRHAEPVAQAAAPRLAPLLKAEIDGGQLEVQDLADRSVVTIKGDGLFEAGSADLPARVKPLLDHIAAALAKVPGPVLVTGHTDNQPVRSLRYPSNWHLSQERANAVRDALAASIGAVAGNAARVRAEGRADSEPVAPNDTPASRAKNRRVEITLGAQPRA